MTKVITKKAESPSLKGYSSEYTVVHNQNPGYVVEITKRLTKDIYYDDCEWKDELGHLCRGQENRFVVLSNQIIKVVHYPVANKHKAEIITGP